jgi:hypothetical protein
MFTLWLLIDAVVCGAVFLGHTYAEPDQLQTLGLEQCGGKLCFLRIVPGITTLKEASAILAWHGFNSATAQGLYSSDRMNVYIQADPQNDIVGHISVRELYYGASLSVPLADILRYLGIPCGFIVGTSVVTELTLMYPYADVSVSLSHEWISPETPITHINIVSQKFWNSCQDSTPWPGFTFVRRYIYLQFKRWA